MTNLIEKLRKEIEAYTGPLTGDSIEATWFREAVRNLLALEQQVAR